MCTHNEAGDVIEKCEARIESEKLIEALTASAEGTITVNSLEDLEKLEGIPEDLKRQAREHVEKLKRENPDAEVQMDSMTIVKPGPSTARDMLKSLSPETILKLAKLAKEQIREQDGGAEFLAQLEASATASNEDAASDPETVAQIEQGMTEWVTREIFKMGLTGQRIRLVPGAVHLEPDVIRHVNAGEARVLLLEHVTGQRMTEDHVKPAGGRDARIREAFDKLEREAFGPEGTGDAPLKAADAGPVASEFKVERGTLVIETRKTGARIDTFLRLK